MLTALIACALACTALQDTDEPSAPEAEQASGAHYQVTCHGCPSGAAEALLAEAEAAHAAVLEALALEDAPLAHALELRVYGAKEEFDEAVRGQATGESELRFREPGSGRAFLCLPHWLSPEAVMRFGVTWQTRRWTAVDAAHLAIAARCTGELPLWLRDGLATWAGERAALELVEGYRPEADPYFGLGQGMVRDQVADEKVELRDVLCGESPSWHASRVANLHHHVFRFLMAPERRDVCQELVRVAREASAGGSRDGLEERMSKALRQPAWKALQKEFQRYCAELAPEWESAGGRLELRGERWFHAALPDDGDYSWRQEVVGERGLAIRGSLEILPGPASRMGILAMDDGKSHLLVSFSASDHTVSVFEWDERAWKWDTLGSAEAAFARGREFAFELLARGKRLRVSVDGAEVLEMPLGRRKTEGRWGLYAEGGAAGIWSGVTVGEG